MALLGYNELTHWDLDKMASLFQMTFWNTCTFSRTNIVIWTSTDLLLIRSSAVLDRRHLQWNLNQNATILIKIIDVKMLLAKCQPFFECPYYTWYSLYICWWFYCSFTCLQFISSSSFTCVLFVHLFTSLCTCLQNPKWRTRTMMCLWQTMMLLTRHMSWSPFRLSNDLSLLELCPRKSPRVPER